MKVDFGGNGETERDTGGTGAEEERERMKGEIERNLLLLRVLPCFLKPGIAGEEGKEYVYRYTVHTCVYTNIF